MKKFFVFNDRDDRNTFMDDVPMNRVERVLRISGPRELELVDDHMLDAILAVPTDVDYVVEERSEEAAQ